MHRIFFLFVLAARMENLSVEFKSLKEMKGHWDGHEFNPEIDSFNGKKHEIMKALEKQVTVGMKVKELVELMGKPDSVTSDLQGKAVETMPGIQLTDPIQQDLQQEYYFVYYWRGKHDFLYFKIGDGDLVAGSDWYSALE